MTEQVTAQNRKRNRIIAIIAGAITVIAIVLGFAGDYLGLPWRGLRPAAELLLLAELVVLVVLERHQLFEPVSEKVSGIEAEIVEIRDVLTRSNLSEVRSTLDTVKELAVTAGQVTLCASPPEVLQAMTKVAREALTREHRAPQVLRAAFLSGRMYAEQQWALAENLRELTNVVLEYLLLVGSSPDAEARNWSVRMIMAAPTAEALQLWLEVTGREFIEKRPLNFEIKVLPTSRVQAVLSPQIITDRDVVLSLDDLGAVWNWGLLFRGHPYLAFFTRWFDDMWTDPDAYLVHSRNGFDEQTFDRIKRDLADSRHLTE
jgi:hypothetical protein